MLAGITGPTLPLRARCRSQGLWPSRRRVCGEEPLVGERGRGRKEVVEREPLQSGECKFWRLGRIFKQSIILIISCSIIVSSFPFHFSSSSSSPTSSSCSCSSYSSCSCSSSSSPTAAAAANDAIWSFSFKVYLNPQLKPSQTRSRTCPE
jgi:hypothetical protein